MGSVNNLNVGLTGSQFGMTREQINRVGLFILKFEPAKVHHGLCIGADSIFHRLVQAVSFPIDICGHPPIDRSKVDESLDGFTHLMDPLPYLDRNSTIVDHSRVLLATPKEYSEQLRSGTWSTVRRARKANILRFIIFPDGTVKTERPD